MSKVLWRWGPTLVWIAIVFYATSVMETGTTFSGGWDKVGHFIAYVVMALLIHRSLWMNQKRPHLGANALLIVVITMSCGLSGELHQRSIPGRDFQWSDLAANFTGVVIALILLLPWYKHAKMRNSVLRP